MFNLWIFCIRELKFNFIFSFHVGSACTDPEAYNKAIEMAKHLFDGAKSYGYQLRVLDIGGGFPGASKTETTFFEVIKILC